MKLSRILSKLVYASAICGGAALADPWMEIYRDDNTIKLIDLASIKTLPNNQREFRTMSSGRGGIDISVDTFIVNCSTATSVNTTTNILSANGQLGQTYQLNGKPETIPYIYKHSIAQFFYACWGTPNRMFPQMNFADSVRFMRMSTPKPK